MIRIKKLREDREISQKKLATDLFISQSALSNYESGTREPNLTLLVQIAKYFNVTLDYLVLGTQDVVVIERSKFDEISRKATLIAAEFKKLI